MLLIPRTEPAPPPPPPPHPTLGSLQLHLSSHRLNRYRGLRHHPAAHPPTHAWTRLAVVVAAAGAVRRDGRSRRADNLFASPRPLTNAHSRRRRRRRRRQAVFVGTAGAGKSSLIARFASDADAAPKPTLALEYTFARR
jgi:hypothetical protein